MLDGEILLQVKEVHPRERFGQQGRCDAIPLKKGSKKSRSTSPHAGNCGSQMSRLTLPLLTLAVTHSPVLTGLIALADRGHSARPATP